MNTYKCDRRVLYMVVFSNAKEDYTYYAKKPKHIPPNAKMYKVVKTMFNGIVSKKRIYG